MIKHLRSPVFGWALIFCAPWAFAGWLFTSAGNSASHTETNERTDIQKWIINEVSSKVRNLSYPEEITRTEDGETENFKIEYTLNSQLQHEADRLLQAYKPDFGAIVVIESATGKIRAMSSYERGSSIGENLALYGSFPAASIFKMVTSAAALDRRGVEPETSIHFNGGSHTLYKRNVMSTTINRWTREVSLRDAFAKSLNTAFGRLAFERLEPSDIDEYAYRFGFNRHIAGDINFDQGVTSVPDEKNYHLAEIASGFNRVTRMSPLQGALMAAVIANDGKMPEPQIMEKVTRGESIVMAARPVVDFEVLSPIGNEKMRELMAATITSGTSRKSFKHLRRDRRFKEVEIGGKTGSLTGTNPRGKTDWFVGYAIGENGESLSIAAVTVHEKLWRVKSAILAQSVVRRHFRDMDQWVAQHEANSEEP